MNSIVLILLAAILVFTSASKVENFVAETVNKNSEFNEGLSLTGRSIKGRIFSSKAENLIRNLLKRMPDGLPEYGLPPLAPFVKEEFQYQINQSFAEINTNFENIRIEGLDDVLINRLDISYFLSQNIKYNFTFPRIIASGKYISDSTIDLIEEFGINVRHYGKGNFEIELENLSFAGNFKYTMPLAFGSISIYNFEGNVALDYLYSNINGLAGKSILNQIINAQVEDFAVKFVHSNQEFINKIVQDVLIPLVNKKFDGKSVWSFLG